MAALCLLSLAPAAAADAVSVGRSHDPAASHNTTAFDAEQQKIGWLVSGDPRPEDEFWLISTRHLAGCPVKAEADLGLRVYRTGDGWTESGLHEFLDTQRMTDKITIFFIHGNRQSPSQAEDEGRLVYRHLLETRPHVQPLRFIIWSWPSEKLRRPLLDTRIKSYRADRHAVYLGNLLAKLEAHAPRSLRVSIMGYSFGARLALGALHLWGGGTLCGTRLDGVGGPNQMQVRVNLLAAAEHNYWLVPGAHHGHAYGRIEHLVMMANSNDPVLKHYRILDRRERARAMGYTGVAGMHQLPDSHRRIAHYDIYQHSHALDAYFYNDYFIEQMRRCVLWDPLD